MLFFSQKIKLHAYKGSQCSAGQIDLFNYENSKNNNIYVYAYIYNILLFINVLLYVKFI